MRKSRRKPFIAIGAGVILLAILFFVLTGDGLWEGKEGSTNSVIEKKKVVFLTKSMDSSFWQSAYAGAGAASAEYNLDLVCEGPDGDGEEDYEAQNEMIDRAIREQVDALLFSAIDFEKNAEAIDRAAKAGIRIVVVDSPVNSEAVECYIGTDNYEAGCMAGEEVLGNPAENLNIGIVNFDKSTENGQLREKGFRDTVLNDDRANITASINVKSTITDAREGTERMLLDNPQINVIVTFNEWTTLGVGDAVEALGAGERTQVVAFDSNVKSIGMLEKGNVDALIVHMQHITVGVHLVAHLHGVAVDLHAALGDDLLGGAAGAQALLAHNFLNAFFCHDKISLCASRRSNRAAAKPLRHACGVPPPLSRGGLGISKSLISSPEAPLLGELSAKQTERLITAASVSKLRVGSPQLRRRLKFTLLRERQAQRRPSSPLSSAER